MSNLNYGGWTVRYGCSKWQASEEKLSEAEARRTFGHFCSRPPVRGKYIADYIILEDDKGETVDSFSFIEQGGQG